MIKGGYIQLLKVRVSSFFILILFPVLIFANSDDKSQPEKSKDKTEATFYIAGDAIVSGIEHLSNTKIVHQIDTEKLPEKKKSTNNSKKTVLKKREISTSAKKSNPESSQLKIVNGNSSTSFFAKSLSECGKYNREDHTIFFGFLNAQVGNWTKSLICKEPIFTFQIRYSAKKPQNKIYIRAPGNYC